MKTKLKLYALTLLMISPLTHAFVSYGDSQPANEVISANKVDTLGSAGKNIKASGQFVIASTPCKNQVGVVDLDVSPRTIPGVLKGGSDVPLSTALRTILPKGWHADKEHEVDFAMPLSWERGEEFTSVLTTIAYKHRLSILISWRSKKIHVRAACENKPLTLPRPADSKDATVKPMPSVATDTLNTWFLSTDKTLKENLQAWSQKAGWQVVWKIKDTDFRVTHNTTLKGSFMEAVEQVVTAYENGNTPISANLYDTDRVIEIVDHTPFKRNTIQ